MIIFSTSISYSQFTWPVITNEIGDTIPYFWPPTDSTYSKNEIIIKFRKDGLMLNNLCFNWMFDNNNLNKQVEKQMFTNSESVMTYLQNERFNIDQLIVDSSLKAYLHSVGGDTLRRITFANPCVDTLSITRSGDTIACTDYLWLTLELNNDTTILNTIITLNYLYAEQLVMATPNFYFKLVSTKTPNDYLFLGNQQKGMDMIGARRAWYFAEGSPFTKVAVIDNGIDYRHCDLGKGIGDNFKVKNGWSFTTADKQVHLNSGHGTAGAGIIGAYTNFHECNPSNHSVAGVAGGWGGPTGNPGVSLYALKCDIGGTDFLSTEYTISAMRLASSNSPHTINGIHHYGYGCNILNCAFTGYDNSLNPAVRLAINYAYENKSLIVAGRGQYDYTDPMFQDWTTLEPIFFYPSCYDPRKVLSVGASFSNKTKAPYSYWNGKSDQMDIIAPGGDCTANETLAWTTFGEFDYNCFSGTSAATAYASGVAALIHGTSFPGVYYLEPEDIQGLIAASALDIKFDSDFPDERYGDYYDKATGHGHLQADKFYDMLDEGYRLFQLTLYRWNNESKFVFTNWNEPHYNHTVVEDRDTDRHKILVKGQYYARFRNYNYDNVISNEDVFNFDPDIQWQIDDENKAYIWTRGGSHSEKARSGFNIRYQNNSSFLLSGYGGMRGGVSMNIHDNENNDTKSVRVKVTGTQYEFLDGPTNNISYPITIPHNDNIAVNISIFVKVIPNTTSISNEVIKSDFVIKTKIEDNLLLVKSINNLNSIQSLVLVNQLGQEVSSNKGVSLKSLSIANVPSGMYILLISDDFGKINSIPVGIVR